LLILSTLTSDGTVNIAGYLIDLYRYDGLEPDLVVLDGNLFKEAVCENAEDSELLSADAYCIICAESQKTMIKEAAALNFLTINTIIMLFV